MSGDPTFFCSLPDDSRPSPPKRVVRQIHTIRNTETKFTIIVHKPNLRLIGSNHIEFYQVTSRTNFDDFDYSFDLYRRYSEFQTLVRVLTKKGVKLPSLSRHRWIPTGRSRWEELNDFGRCLGELSPKFSKDCLQELKRFFQDPCPYWEEP